jgi:competence ComEA-like helix-hairpin-helix protein
VRVNKTRDNQREDVLLIAVLICAALIACISRLIFYPQARQAETFAPIITELSEGYRILGGRVLIDVNLADADLLATLPGIGPSLARRIADYRSEHGMFKATDDLLNVNGIGPATLERLKDWAYADK